MNNIKHCLLTNDVETTSILYNSLRDKTGLKVLQEGMPLLLDLYQKYNIKSTFFFTGYIAEKFPEIVKMILPYKHEVACHGYSHEVNMGFDILNLEQQIEELKKAKTILEDISGQEVISFRAPALRVNKYTPEALKYTGFKIDSSVASQRLDMFFSFGSTKKLNWIFTPRKPYKTRDDSLWRPGKGAILEIPISALIFPYIGTFLRASPLLTRILRNLLYIESIKILKPIVFLIHPNEFINEGKSVLPNIRTSKLISYIIKDKLRQKIKLKNLGSKAIPLYENEIIFFNDLQFDFVTLREYYNYYLSK